MRKCFGELERGGRSLYWVDLGHKQGLSYLAGLTGRPGLGLFFDLGLPLKFYGNFFSNFLAAAAEEKRGAPPNPLEQMILRIFNLEMSASLFFLVYVGLAVDTLFLFKGEEKRPFGVLKAARSGEDKGLGREFEILAHLHQNSSFPFRSSLPPLFTLESVEGRPVLALGFVGGRKKEWSVRNPSKVEKDFREIRTWVTELGRIPVDHSRKKMSRFNEARSRIRKAASRMACPEAVIKVIVQTQKFGDAAFDARFPTVVTHRDLSPTNLLEEGGQLRVVDWGNGHYGYPLTDWIRFVCHFLLETKGPARMGHSLSDLFDGKSVLSRLFFKETKSLLSELSLPADGVAPLVLLSVFDFLESYHYGKEGDWEMRFLGPLSSSAWIEQLA